MSAGDAGDAEAARRRHFGVFYGLAPLPDGPLVVVHGNCQAESLRLALSGADLEGVRIPPVHELTASDLPHLQRLLPHVSVLITQPVRDGYHGLPLGSGELARTVGPQVEVVVVPVIRYSGLYPTQAIIRPPSNPSLVPTLVPYHDLRLLLEAAGRPRLGELAAETVRAVGRHSLEQLRRRESAHATVVVSDLFAQPSFDLVRTINHPGNPVWEALAGRVRAALGLAPPTALTRPLLNAIHAPRSPEVIAAFDLSEDPDLHWHVDGQTVDPEQLRALHLAWYRQHPEAVSAGLQRHAEVLELLGA